MADFPNSATALNFHSPSIPVPPASLRPFIERRIERLIAMLDLLDGDADLEPSFGWGEREASLGLHAPQPVAEGEDGADAEEKDYGGDDRLSRFPFGAANPAPAPMTRRAFCGMAASLAAATVAPVAMIATTPVPRDAFAAAQLFIVAWREAGNDVVLYPHGLLIRGRDGLVPPAAERIAPVNEFPWPEIKPHVVAILTAEGATAS